MVEDSEEQVVAAAMRRINAAWLDGDVDGLARLIHPQVVMVFPGFAGRMQGREEFLSGFRDFCQKSEIEEFIDYNQQIDLAGDTAVVNFQYNMLYERSDSRYRSTGRDLWIFQKDSEAWIAVWRTMLDVEERAA